ncbi:MAG: hypothetical protein M3Z62_13010, partial [Metasolibacillus sp.]|nr:hypothetical protein [Metasolibacillus sp.]MCT6941338.1 hypothetical protein [Metasolibacillus sp.]
VALVKGYSEKMDVNYLYSNVFVFLLMSKNKKTENSVKIYATLVEYGITLKKGELILPGALSSAVAVSAGDKIVASFGKIGTVTVHFD